MQWFPVLKIIKGDKRIIIAICYRRNSTVTKFVKQTGNRTLATTVTVVPLY